MLRLQHLTQSLETETVAFSQFTNTHNSTVRLTVSGQGLHFLAICWLMMHCVVSHFIRTTERNSHYLMIHDWENNTFVLSFPLNSAVCTHADMPTSVHMYESWRRQWVCAMSWKSSVRWPGLSLQKKKSFLIFQFHFELALIGSFQVVHWQQQQLATFTNTALTSIVNSGTSWSLCVAKHWDIKLLAVSQSLIRSAVVTLENIECEDDTSLQHYWQEKYTALRWILQSDKGTSPSCSVINFSPNLYAQYAL